MRKDLPPQRSKSDKPMPPYGLGTYTKHLPHLLPPDRGNNGGGGYPAGVSGTSRVFHWRIAGNDSGYFQDLVVLFRFCCFPVFHAPNVGAVNFHRLWCVFGPFYFLFMHHDLLDEEPQQLRCQLLNICVPLRFVEERYRRVDRRPRPAFVTLVWFLPDWQIRRLLCGRSG